MIARHHWHPTDTEVVARVRAGERDAFRLLFERHHPGLVRYLVAQTGDPLLADDLAQDVFLAAFEHLPNLPGDRQFAPWLYRIAHNRLRRAWRRRGLRRVFSLDVLFERSFAGVLMFTAEPDPGDACARADLVGRALADLSPGQRAVLVLHDIEGFSVAEIAQITGSSRAATERRVSRARSAMRARYYALDDQ